MIKIDETFLEEVGLANLPAEEKAAFMAHTQEELERRVGERVSANLSVAQLKEFEGIMNGDRLVMQGMLAKIKNYGGDPMFRKIMERRGEQAVTLELVKEYLSVKWIQMNRPDYAEVAKTVANELKDEIMNSREQILAA